MFHVQVMRRQGSVLMMWMTGGSMKGTFSGGQAWKALMMSHNTALATKVLMPNH
jgi:hypothetical protein